MRTGVQRKLIVNQAEIENILAMRETAKSIKQRLEVLQETIKSQEQEVISKLDQGANVSPGEHVLSIRETEKRFPAWKEHFIEACGKTAADEILEGTEAMVYRDLLIKVAA
jgi:hypothetical protein